MAYCTSCGREVPPGVNFCPSCGAPVGGSAPPPTPPPGGTPPPVSVSDGTGKYCQHCGAVIPREAEVCPKCGRRVLYAQTSEPKSPGIAAVLSFLFTGLGQIYNGQIEKGIMFVIIGIICIFTVVVLIGFILYPAFWIYNIYDAYRSAKLINAGVVRPE